jgi:hypothetical protein
VPFLNGVFCISRPERFDKSVDSYEILYRPAYEDNFKAVKVEADVKDEAFKVSYSLILRSRVRIQLPDEKTAAEKSIISWYKVNFKPI